MTRKRVSIKRLACAAGVLPPALLGVVLSFLFLGTLEGPPATRQERSENAAKHVLGLRRTLRHQDGVARMQQAFPEGGCFMVTLYALSWTNLMLHHDPDPATRRTAVEEVEWALGQYDSPEVAGPFSDTQVRNGVFWLGQRNLALGQFLAALPEARRPEDMAREFHANSGALHRAFLASPTGHLDSYPDLCWPADNVTALRSLLVHDELYATSYRTAFEHWKDWTARHHDVETGLPAGHLDSETGRLFEQSRGCANSWILALLPEMDAKLSRRLYGRYREHHLIRRFGYRVFREHPAHLSLAADVDSGPVVLGAGATATGVGLAAAFANGDRRTARDIHGIARTVGLRRAVATDLGDGVDYLFGRLPMGDAFLTWAYTLPAPQAAAEERASPARVLWDRKLAASICLLLTISSAVLLRRLSR